MKNKKILLILSLIFIGILSLSSLYYFKSKKEDKKTIKKSNLAIIINSNGVETSSNEIPKGSYTLNEEKTICENGGKVKSYDSKTGQIGFSFLGSDRCTLYFDEVDTEPPVISNLVVKGKNVTATLSDNVELKDYYLSKRKNFTSGGSWIKISGKSFDLNLTQNTAGNYYLFVRDTSNNRVISSKLIIGSAYETIILNSLSNSSVTITTITTAINNIKNKTTPDFTQGSTTNEGLYAMEDDLGTSYYFRGAVDNNWVKFGKYTEDYYRYEGYDSSKSYSRYFNSLDECNSSAEYNTNCTAYKYANKGDDMYWRIIRINGDGSIRMIYSGTTAPTDDTKVIMTGIGTTIGETAFNYDNDKAEYAGYMYTIGEQHGTSTDSTIKSANDNWFKKTTLLNDANINSLIADEIFCNDRRAVNKNTNEEVTQNNWYSTINVDYAYDRIQKNINPILTCPTNSDKFTVNSNNGNGALSYPVGFLTADEAIIAGNSSSSFINSANDNYVGNYYLGTPSSYAPGWGILGYHFRGAVSEGYFGLRSINSRPVINLSKDVILSGDGTYNNVYTVS